MSNFYQKRRTKKVLHLPTPLHYTHGHTPHPLTCNSVAGSESYGGMLVTHHITERERELERERGQNHWAEADPHTLSKLHTPILTQKHRSVLRTICHSHTKVSGPGTCLLDLLWTSNRRIF